MSETAISSDLEKAAPPRVPSPTSTLARWAIVLASGLIVWLAPAPAGITPVSWRLFAIFVATIVGSIVRPIPAGAIVLLGVTALAATRTLPVEKALSGYADPVVWITLPALILSRGLLKTGLGRRIALTFIRMMGQRSLGLGYALVLTDLVLATVIPSNAARSGGVIFPIGRSMADAFDSRPGPTAGRLGAFLTVFLYQCDVVIGAMFLTGHAGNLLIAKFAMQTAGVELGYAKWAVAGIVPGVASLVVTGLVLYWLIPPEISHTPTASRLAAEELAKMGRMTRHELVMLSVFGLVAVLWSTTAWHGIHYSVVGLIGVAVLMLAGVLDWTEILKERTAWDVFIWYGGLVMMAGALGETGITQRFADVSASFTAGWTWWVALGVLMLVYFYAHYAFASISAHATAMYIPFVVVSLAAGAPVWVAVFGLAVTSTLGASLTNYGTTPAPIYFSAGYVSQRTWWLLGLAVSIPNILVWTVVGLVWWRVLGLW